MNTRVIQAIDTLRRSSATAALVAGLVLPSAATLAATQVNGNLQDVSIDAQNSSLKDILTALSKQFGIQFQTTANLDKPVTGTYEGSLRRVVTRLLEGYNFIITSHADQIHVTVLGTGVPEQIGGVAASSAQSATIQQPKAVANPVRIQQAATAAGSNEQRKSIKKESTAPAPLPQLKLAEGGPAPVPAPVPAGTSGPGPMPGPATNSLPKPNPVTNGGPGLPMPAPVSANGPQLPMPTEVKPFPMSAGSANAPLPGPPASSGAAPAKP